MFTAREFWITRRRAGLEFGSGPPFLTAMVMSLPMRANCFAMRFQRANIACFLTSKMRPMNVPLGWGRILAYFFILSALPHDFGVSGRGPLQNAQQRHRAGRQVHRRLALLIFVLVLGVLVIGGARRGDVRARPDLLRR